MRRGRQSLRDVLPFYNTGVKKPLRLHSVLPAWATVA